MTGKWTVTTRSAEETRALGATLGSLLQGGDVILLSGHLGAGKTTLTQGIAEGMGVRAYTKSPSFVLVNEYRQGRIPLYHMDFYRIEDPNEAWDLGIEDYLRGPGVLVAEWAERALSAFPPDCLRVSLAWVSEGERTLAFTAEGPRSADVLKHLREAWGRGG
jgi:tRNA threonylcarbamoyladenosine biosynthesis protein TsaE